MTDLVIAGEWSAATHRPLSSLARQTNTFRTKRQLIKLVLFMRYLK